MYGEGAYRYLMYVRICITVLGTVLNPRRAPKAENVRPGVKTGVEVTSGSNRRHQQSPPTTLRAVINFAGPDVLIRIDMYCTVLYIRNRVLSPYAQRNRTVLRSFASVQCVNLISCSCDALMTYCAGCLLAWLALSLHDNPLAEN